MGEAFFGDWFITGAVNRGLPLSGVISSRNLASCADTFAGSILLAPVPDADSPMELALFAAAKAGAKLMLYGPVDHASEAMLSAIGVVRAAPLSGVLKLRTLLTGDTFGAGTVSERLEHVPTYSAGDVNTQARPDIAALAEAVDAEGHALAYATHNPATQTVWIRGSFNYTIQRRLPLPFAPAERFPADALPRLALSCFGVTLRNQKQDAAMQNPLIIGAKRDGGYYLSGYSPVTTTALSLRLPHGAPLLIGAETALADGMATYTMLRAWHHECRVLVSGQASGNLSCVESFPLYPSFRRRIIIRGLVGATVTVLTETIQAQPLLAFAGDSNNAMPVQSLPYAENADGSRTLTEYTGTLQITW